MRIDKKILKNLIPGLLPLFVFVVADELWGTLIGLYVAIGIGFLELMMSYVKFGKFEKFILLDLGLLILLGSVSILLKDDIYFKLKPAFIELIFAAILGFSVFSSKNIIFEMSLRYLKDEQIMPAAKKKLDKTLKGILFLTLFHVILVVYASYFMSKEAWAFISGVLFYCIILAYFGVEFIRNRFISGKSETDEMLPVVDEDGNVKGKAARGDCHFNPSVKILHPVVHLHVMNPAGEIYLQQRAITKKVQAGKWDTAVGGHILYGEDLESGLLREAKEEIGISKFKPRFVQKYIWETDVEKELVFMFVCNTKSSLKVNPEEISEGKFWEISRIRESLGKGIFTPNFEKEFLILAGEEQRVTTETRKT
jgi:isopentenyldiphosphate isomerase/intracellular septation protein A